MLDSKDQSIAVQVAAKIAADLAIAAADVQIDQIVADFAVAFPTVKEAIMDAVNAAVAAAALPGSVAVPAPAAIAAPVGVPVPAPMAVPAPVAAPVPAAQPAPIPGATDGDPKEAGHWAMLAQDASTGQQSTNWYDNRASKKSNKHPDFRHKTATDGKYNVGLYLNSKGRPSWVDAWVAQLPAF